MDSHDTGPTLTPNEARGARIVRGGAVRRILWVSLAIAVIAMIVAYLFTLR